MAVSTLMIGVPSHVRWLTGVRSGQRALVGVSRRVRHEDLRVETAARQASRADPAPFPAGPRRRLLGLDCSTRTSRMQTDRIRSCSFPFFLGFDMDPGDRLLEGRDHLEVVLGDGEGQ